jgi:transposase
VSAALANKLARIAWTVLARERSYEARVTKAAAWKGMAAAAPV